MSLQYVGLSEINGPLVFLDNVENASYEEMVEIKCGDGTTRLGRVVQLEGRKAAIQWNLPEKHKNKIYRKADGAGVVTRDAGANL